MGADVVDEKSAGEKSGDGRRGRRGAGGRRVGVRRRFWRRGAVPAKEPVRTSGAEPVAAAGGGTAAARPDDPGRAPGRPGDPREPADERPDVPIFLAVLAGWCWRLIVIGVVMYGLITVVAQFKLVVIPCVVALLLCALLQPLTGRLRALGLPGLAATWVTILLALAVLGGIGTYVGIRANAEFPKLASELQRTSRDVQRWLVTGPLHLRSSQLESYVEQLVKYIQDRRGEMASTAVHAGAATIEVLAALVFVMFVTFFLLKDGARIWDWLIQGFGGYRSRVDRAGRAAWETLSQYVHGTVMVAAIHAIVLAIVLAIMGVPLVAPLAVVIFIGSFIPIVGILVGGTLAVAVTFSAKGWVAGLVFLAILLVEHQIEGHVLQPLIVGRWVRLHPLAIILAISVGGILGGIPGAAVAVPFVAVITRAWPALRGSPEETPAEDDSAPDPAPSAR